MHLYINIHTSSRLRLSLAELSFTLTCIFLTTIITTTPTEKDVNRTDRNHPFFEGEHNPNVTLLHDILMTFVMYNFDLGYVQGMSDLLAPILYVTQDEATAFWCFVGYMDMVVSGATERRGKDKGESCG